MTVDSEVIGTEGRFFDALLRGDRQGLENILGDDFVLIDVMTGSEIPRGVVLDLVGSRQLAFESIERLDARVRLYDSTAVVTGQTRMSGHYDAQRFQVHSRYTHVYVHGRAGWLLVTAQGTTIAKSAV
jgi:hypothetical protein